MRQAFFLAALLLISPLPVCFAAEGGAGEKADPVQIYREAGVNSEQEARIRQLAQGYENASRVRIERIRNLSKQLTALSYEPELDEKKILVLQDEINEIQIVMNTERVKLMLKIRALLTSEQKTKLIALLKERAAKPALQENSQGSRD